MHVLNVIGHNLKNKKVGYPLNSRFRFNENYSTGSHNVKIVDANPNNIKDYSYINMQDTLMDNGTNVNLFPLRLKNVQNEKNGKNKRK